ncbi:MAG: hypothetical protein ACUVTN_08905 [Thermodesulfobacteriota bacterium]
MNREAPFVDVVVLGEGFGGLVSATLLAQARLSVLVLKEKGYSSFYLRGGYRFVPFSNFSEKRIRTHLIQEISKILYLPNLIHSLFDKLSQEHSFQILLPQARIDLFPFGPFFEREMEREFPREVENIKDFFLEMRRIKEGFEKYKNEKEGRIFFPLSFPSFWRKFAGFRFKRGEEIGKRLSSFSKEFREFIKLQILSYGNFTPDRADLSLASYLLLNQEEIKGWVDLEAMKEFIFKNFIDSGGRVLELEELDHMEKRGRDGFHLFLKKESSSIPFKFMILNAPIQHLYSRFEFLQKNLSKWVNRVKPSHIILPLLIGIRERVIPVGMKDLLISVLDLEKSYEDGNLLFLSLSPKGDESQAPEGRRALLVEGLVSTDKLDQKSLEYFQKGVISHLGHIIPFFEDFVEFIDFQWTTDKINKISYPHFLYETNSNFYWREGLIPTKLSKSLFFVGKENFPYLGIEGEILCGLRIGEEILKIRKG